MTNREPQTKRAGDERPEQYAFPTKSRCPGCHSLETHAYRTVGQIQYRRCDACGQRYSVGGEKV